MPPKSDHAWRHEDFIYDLRWGKKADGDFIDFLAFEATIGKFVWPDKVNISLVHVIDCVNSNNSEFFYLC